MEKHAYLIFAHRDDYTFYSLLKMLDHEKNDIFIHMDLKNRLFDKTQAESALRKSRVFFTERTKVSWGGFSMINAELLLLKAATGRGEYSYYHLLSGQDLPIKTQPYIHDFFETHKGTEFVRFQSNEFAYSDRVRYYYLLQEIVGRKTTLAARGIKAIQMALKVHRNKGIAFQKGSNWFSITDDLARRVISQEEWIKKVFRYTTCCDEVFLQTVIMNSEFKDNLVKSDFDNDSAMFMRLVDWERGNPYIFKMEDKTMLKHSDMLFARKFSAEVDKDIIDWVAAQYGNQEST